MRQKLPVMLDQISERAVQSTGNVAFLAIGNSQSTDVPTCIGNKRKPVTRANATRRPRIKPKKSVSSRQTVQTLLNCANPSVTSPCTYIIPVTQMDGITKVDDAKHQPVSSVIGLNSIVPLSIAPAVSLPSISAITLPLLSPDDKTGNSASSHSDGPSCLEDYVTNIVGQSIGHLGNNITSADLVDKVTQVLRALSSVKETKPIGLQEQLRQQQSVNEGEAAQQHQQRNSSQLDYYGGSQESEPRFQDPHWNMHSQSSGSSQVLEPFGVVGGSEGAKSYSVEETAVLPLEVVGGVLKHAEGESTRIVSSVSADMLDLIMNTVTLASPSKANPADNLEQIASVELVDLPAGYAETLTAEFYCVECDSKYKPQPCAAHSTPYTKIDDTPILSAARISLPAALLIGKSLVASGEEGVFATEKICKKAKFGPLIGERRSLNPGEEPDGQFVWLNSRKNGVICCVDENKSNWMRFVQLARNRAEQNVIAFMENEQIYMVTCRDIEPNTELKMWYSAEYATLIGITPIACPTLKCDLCNRRLTSKTQLNQHRTYCHPDETKHRCAYCMSEFTTAQALQNHCRRHLLNGTEKLGRLKCGYCERTFNNAGNLKVHMRIHTGEKRYACEICQRSFTQHAHLRSHLLTHSKIKNFICRYCHKTFARGSDLKVHERKHTRQNIMRCDECGKEFFKLDNFKCHQKIHLNQKDFACLGCGKAFSKKYHLVRHLRICKGSSKVER